MSDICTVIAVTRTLMACVPAAQVCDQPDRNDRIMCREVPAKADCNFSVLKYECTSPDGSKYSYEERGE